MPCPAAWKDVVVCILALAPTVLARLHWAMADGRHGQGPKLSAAVRIRASGSRATRWRIRILQALLDAGKPVSHQELQESLRRDTGEVVDRVTLYRNLDWLLQKGLAHRITTDDRVWRFGVADDAAHPPHPHFRCLRCGELLCLADMQLPRPELPQGYALRDVDMVVNGICPHCRVQATVGDHDSRDTTASSPDAKSPRQRQR
ncbi:MAG: Fur family transcriptional regulator [Acidithiobacillus caldus]|nr:Fur family transcriptional regulator [Acidithiobacillus caldus]